MKKFIVCMGVCMIIASIYERNFNAVTGWLAAVLFLINPPNDS